MKPPLFIPTIPLLLSSVMLLCKVHTYSRKAELSPHTATGDGLHTATTGSPSSFQIKLIGQDQWRPNDTFVYVWVASTDHIFIAEVADNGNETLTATYETSFPGEYLIHIEEVTMWDHDEGRRIAGSPFSLTVTGAPTVHVDQLPVCGMKEEDIATSFWRPGSWVSSNFASAAHGVGRNRWVFQPKTCVYDTFTHKDLMVLASLEQETWLLVLGNSVQRGIFLTLVDMMLVSGQKQHFRSSAISKCWGYAEVRVGNLRVTYQVSYSMKAWIVRHAVDSSSCFRNDTTSSLHMKAPKHASARAIYSMKPIFH